MMTVTTASLVYWGKANIMKSTGKSIMCSIFSSLRIVQEGFNILSGLKLTFVRIVDNYSH
jgi:hypothetical protein